MTHTDNLEAGAGDLVAELNRIADMAAETIDTGGREEFDPRGVKDVLLEAAAQLAAVTAENARLTRERDEARTLVAEANNSLYGSQGYFHSLNGGAFDKYHLASGIEALKESSRKAHTAEAENARLREALEPFAEAADSTDANDDYSSASIWEHPCALDITIGHLRAARRARAALSQEAPK